MGVNLCKPVSIYLCLLDSIEKRHVFFTHTHTQTADSLYFLMVPQNSRIWDWKWLASCNPHPWPGARDPSPNGSYLPLWAHFLLWLTIHHSQPFDIPFLAFSVPLHLLFLLPAMSFPIWPTWQTPNPLGGWTRVSSEKLDLSPATLSFTPLCFFCILCSHRGKVA